MSLIVSETLQHYFLTLKENIDGIFSATDQISFSIKIHESIKILSYLSNQLGSKKNILGSSSFSSFVLARILNFLPSYSLEGLRSICSKQWWQVLRMPTIQNFIIKLKYQFQPKGLTFLRSWKMPCLDASTLWLIGNKLFIWIAEKNVVQILSTKGTYLDEWPILSSNIRFISLSNKYMCYVQRDFTVNVFTPDTHEK